MKGIDSKINLLWNEFETEYDVSAFFYRPSHFGDGLWLGQATGSAGSTA